MLCMYVPVSVRKCLACVFSMFHVKKKKMDLAILTFGGGERYRLLLSSLYLAAAFTLKVLKNRDAWPSLH